MLQIKELFPKILSSFHFISSVQFYIRNSAFGGVVGGGGGGFSRGNKRGGGGGGVFTGE